MFIKSIKINGGIALRVIIVVLSLFMLGVFALSVYKIFFTSGKFFINDKIQAKEITEISPENYTNILQAVHENPNSYIGMKVKFTGYVYRLFDFKDEEFVIARNMFINDKKTQTVVVGFLCNYKDADHFEDGTWVELIGTIEKGKYHNEEIPIIKAIKLNETQKPNQEFVNLPDNTYVPTSGIF